MERTELDREIRMLRQELELLWLTGGSRGDLLEMGRRIDRLITIYQKHYMRVKKIDL